MRVTLEERVARPWMTAVLAAIGITLTFAITSVFMLSSGVDPLSAYRQFLIEPLTYRYGIMEVLVSSTPLLLTGAAVVFAFRAGYWNIGAEGQLLCGAIAAAGLGPVVGGISKPLAIVVMVAAGMAAGATWALIPAILRVRFGTDEVVTTLLLNPVALLLVSGLLNGPWRDPVSGFPKSERIAASAEFPVLADRSRLHMGFMLAVVVILIGWFVSTRTPIGVKLRAVGISPSAARFAGIDVERMLLLAALVSGAIAGLAGVSEVAGIQFRLTEGISPGYGYVGIVVATLGALSMLGAGVGAVFLGLINVGADTVSGTLDIPSQVGQVVQATLLLVTIALLVFRRYRIKRVR